VRVIQANEQIGASLVRHDVSTDPTAKAELLTKGGKVQVPYLEDTDRGVSMYESLDIIEYLKTYYGKGVEVVVREVGNVCPID
jgi:glutathione S-transferase